MKLIFMGTPDFAATILEGLIGSRHEILAVVTQPDKKKGRNQKLSASPVKELALMHGLVVYQPNKVKEPQFLDLLNELKPDAIIVAAFGQILPKALLDIPKYGCINVHASLLPKYRGAAPIQYAILDGETETGISIMYMDEGIDTGDVILQEKLVIEPDETGGSLFEKMAALGASCLLTALEQIENKTAVRIKQDHEQATYVKMISKDMGRLDFSQPAVKLERMVRGLDPWPSAFTFLDGKTLKIWKAAVEEDDEASYAARPGEIIELRRDAIVVKTGEGKLLIKELQLEGKKRLPADAFLRGYKLACGCLLG
ncbi:MAG: methionyl-tRNA formyltransferase [Clostridiales bacterium]|nr:methionyl-tRNA formyltransferase [Clostridiales bacterium]